MNTLVLLMLSSISMATTRYNGEKAEVSFSTSAMKEMAIGIHTASCATIL